MTLPAGNGDDDDLGGSFADQSLAGQLLDAAYAAPEDTSDSVPVSRLYAYATGRLHHPDLAIERALRANAELRAAYLGLLSRQAWAVSEVAMAAAAGAFPDRVIRSAAPALEHRLRVVVDGRQHFLVIELDPKSEIASGFDLSAVDRETGERHGYALSGPVQGVIQMRLPPDAPLLALLRKADTLITLSPEQPVS
jgi:hypothetical protein